MSSKVAALYIRVSTEDQTELSPDAQKRLLLDYAQKNDMIVSGDFIFTESVSGRHGTEASGVSEDDRPGEAAFSPY